MFELLNAVKKNVFLWKNLKIIEQYAGLILYISYL